MPMDGFKVTYPINLNMSIMITQLPKGTYKMRCTSRVYTRTTFIFDVYQWSFVNIKFSLSNPVCVLIDKKLSWAEHIDHISRKVSKSIGLIIKARKSLDNDTLLNLYNALILPHIFYCIQVWGTVASVQCYLLTRVWIRIRVYMWGWCLHVSVYIYLYVCTCFRIYIYMGILWMLCPMQLLFNFGNKLIFIYIFIIVKPSIWSLLKSDNINPQFWRQMHGHRWYHP